MIPLFFTRALQGTRALSCPSGYQGKEGLGEIFQNAHKIPCIPLYKRGN